MIRIATYLPSFDASPLARWRELGPWALCADAPAIVRALLAELPAQHYRVAGEVAVHRSAEVEPGAVLKGPLILGPQVFVGAGAYLRGGNWVAERCSLGPGVELKSSFLLANTRLAHFNFVGDSLLGCDVNLEAGSIVCNHRNERPGGEVLVRIDGQLHNTGCPKFGALIGDGARIGANAVLAPGALLLPGAIVGRAQLCDQELAPG